MAESGSTVDNTVTNAPVTEGQTKAPSPWRIIWREIYRDKIALIALIVFVSIMFTTFIWAATLDEGYAKRVDLMVRNQAPSEAYVWGTDEGGRDMRGMMVLGARNSILVGFSVSLLGSFLGILVGLIAGFHGGNTDNVIMRIVDTWAMLPQLMIIIVFVSLMRDYEVWHFIGILVLFTWVGTARLMRAMALQQRNLDYVSASKTLGTRNIVIMFREVLPNMVPIICVNLTLSLAANMGVETGLTFLGFGLPFGTPSLGTLISHARLPAAMQFRMYQWLPSALLVFGLMLCIYCVGQALSRATDVRSRRG